LDAKPKTQIWTALIAGTIPMGLLQATTTQNDLVVSMWLTALAYLLLYTIRYKVVTALSILSGMGLGLAILTKGTGYVFSAPFLVFLFIFSIYKIYARAVVQFVIVGIIALCLNLGYFARNLYAYNELISGSGGIDDVRIHNVNLQNTVSNMTRNIGLHITVPNQDATNTLQQSIFAIHRWLGMDINNPDTTFGGTYYVYQLKLHEDLEGNPFHLIMIFMATIVWLRNKKTPLFNLYAISLFSSFILFSALLKWQVSGSRLQLPFFILSSPFIAISLGKLQIPALEKLLSIILILISCFYVFYTRPYRIEKRTHDISNITRDYLYVYRFDPKSFLRLKKKIETTQCENIGLLVAGNDPEYPIWYSQQHNIKYEHILINDSGSLIYDSNEVICMLLVSDNVMNVLNADLGRKEIVLSNYRLTWQSPFWYIYVPTK
jgi:4-amino-4-deoxy-L-arabinose transferase-like glycosyltransferase